MTGKKEAVSVPATEDELLQMEEVAAILKCSRSQAYALASSGTIPTLRFRGSVRSPRSKLMRWIAANSTDSSPHAA